MKKYLKFLSPILSLIIGGLIYILFRENHIVLNIYIRKGYILDLSNIIAQSNIKKDLLFDVIVNSLPGGLWAYSLLRTMGLIWDKDQFTKYYFFSLLAFMIIIIPEILQYFNLVQGVFDIKDMIVYFTFSLTALIFNNRGKQHGEQEKKHI
ncbi:hypothetical protein [Leptospira levettii]|uniref:hypothetical protein n=1 Tax=Leptospira levettii TaxID=2023178 RepID=UPI000C2B4771|nr:hypothetical protein [Leptospira levettii]PJZ87451.1 hypothetical protein CH368_16730 [Leptospira levettii]